VVVMGCADAGHPPLHGVCVPLACTCGWLRLACDHPAYRHLLAGPPGMAGKGRRAVDQRGDRLFCKIILGVPPPLQDAT
jgi:hypothetical protein